MTAASSRDRQSEMVKRKKAQGRTEMRLWVPAARRSEVADTINQLLALPAVPRATARLGAIPEPDPRLDARARQLLTRVMVLMEGAPPEIVQRLEQRVQLTEDMLARRD